ncbi:MAG TPA: 50S ribosomal protein L11 methyltransferase [Desulfobacteraceae bacterium]|nr:50S ribosomal protein L11 methyltransferase [Desulfobacteraceae bacterium]
MKWIEIRACFEAEDTWLAEELVSDIFFTLGLKGVVCSTPLPEPDDGFQRDSPSGSTANAVSGYLPASERSEGILTALEEKFDTLKEHGIAVTITTKTIDQEEWAESWKAFFYAARITDRIVVKPAWRDFDAEPGDIIVEIDPGMAFGTGTHETTSMCLAMIEEYLEPGNSFFDVGTGSGILMIAAAKLGAKRMTGIDNDEVAVAIARENLEKNRIPSETYQVLHNTIEHTDVEPFDLVTANILAEVIIDILPDIRKRVKPGGTAVFSGIIQEKKEAVLSELAKNDFCVISTRTMGEWVALSAKPM